MGKPTLHTCLFWKLSNEAADHTVCNCETLAPKTTLRFIKNIESFMKLVPLLEMVYPIPGYFM